MKKLILLLALALVMCGCTQHVKDFGIVTKVNERTCQFDDGDVTLYRITVYRMNARYKVKTYIYTNMLYNVGDTIQITKKN